jgi:hypothetical protein
MKHLVFVFLIFFLSACQKKAMPVITERKTSPPPKVAAIYPPAGTVVPDTLTGKSVFINRCGRCHGLPDLASYTTKIWEGILESMIPRARIEQQNAVHVRAYVMANAAK